MFFTFHLRIGNDGTVLEMANKKLEKSIVTPIGIDYGEELASRGDRFFLTH